MHTQESLMNTNLYLIEQIDRERRQHFVDQAARDVSVAQLADNNITRSQTMKRITRTILAAIVALTILGAGSQAIVAEHEATPQVASLCCIYR
jgi:hypothetical protein